MISCSTYLNSTTLLRASRQERIIVPISKVVLVIKSKDRHSNFGNYRENSTSFECSDFWIV